MWLRLYDADERLVFFNAKYTELYPEAAPALVIGQRFEDILRESCRNGIHRDSGLSVEAWIARALDAHRSGTSFVQRLGGRWISVDNKRLSNGSLIGMRTDITAIKDAEIALERERSSAGS